jgi:hypothetical protein
VVAVAFLGALAPTVSHADPVDAYAHAKGGSWWYKPSDSGSSSVWFGTLSWASTARINWTVPTFTANSLAQPTAPVPFSETKFDVPAMGFPTAKTWVGYSINGTNPGPPISTVNSTGSGSSNVGPVFYGANWTVTGTGTKNYDVYAVAKDPWNMYASDFTNFTDPTYSLYIPFSMAGGQSDLSKTSSGFGFDVSYTTSDGTLDLLNVLVNGNQVTVTTDQSLGSQLLFYQQSDATTSPDGMSTTPGTLLSTSDLATLITNSVNSAGTWTSEIDLGIVLSGIAIPTGTLSDGSVAVIEQDAIAFESNAVPEPSSLMLISIGLLVVLGRVVRA